MYHQYQLYSLHGQSKDALAKTKVGAWEYDIIGPWYKCNMTNIIAAIGLKQFDRYEGLMQRRHNIIKKYDAVCDELGVMHLTHEGEDFRSSGHLYITRIPGIDEANSNDYPISFYDMDWHRLDVRYGHHEVSDMEKPGHFHEMVDLAARLSKGFPFVRVDFFDTPEKLFIAELTFYPGGGNTEYHPLSFDRQLGDQFVLPNENVR